MIADHMCTRYSFVDVSVSCPSLDVTPSRSTGHPVCAFWRKYYYSFALLCVQRDINFHAHFLALPNRNVYDSELRTFLSCGQ